MNAVRDSAFMTGKSLELPAGCAFGAEFADQGGQFLEMVHDGIGAKLFSRSTRIPKPNRDKGDARRPRSAGIDLAVANHDGSGELPAGKADKLQDMPGVRLVEGICVAASHGIEKGGDPKCGQEPQRQPLALIRAKGEPRPQLAGALPPR